MLKNVELRLEFGKFWHSAYEAITVDEAYDNFFDIFLMHYNTSCPIVKVVHISEK